MLSVEGIYLVPFAGVMAIACMLDINIGENISLEYIFIEDINVAIWYKFLDWF